MAEIYFKVFLVISVLCALGVMTARHPITGAVNLVGVMLSLAGIYAVNNAPFLGIVQILVYAGAIMMLVVFVIMVLNSARDNTTPRGGGVPAIIGTLTALVLVVSLSLVFIDQAGSEDKEPTLQAHEAAQSATAQSIGQTLFNFDGTGWYILFEVVGLVLLTALAGAVLLAKRRLSTSEPVGDQASEAGH